MHVAVVGISTDPVTCGVRDHATLLARGLEREGTPCTLHWLSRTEPSLAGSRAEIEGFARGLGARLAEQAPDAVLLQYSAFTYSYRGVPVFVPAVLKAVRRAEAPLLTLLHEYAYPWGRAGLRGTVWALAQRAFLLELARASSALIVTTGFRAAELSAKRWLPRRRIAVAPVFSNLPPPRTPAQPAARVAGGDGATLGLFGYASEATAMTLVLDALRLLRGGGTGSGPRLCLLGSPGAGSAAGRAWREQAAARGLGEALSFSGTLSAQALSDALAACELLLFADPTGPTSRKGTLAASLASGTPLVAIDGPRAWRELSEARAARVVAPTAQALAEAIATLLDDGRARAELGERGRAFAEREMSVARSAQVVSQLLRASA